MKRRARVALSLLTCIAGGMATMTVDAQGTVTEAAVSKLAADWLSAWNARDVDAVMALYSGPKAWFINGGTAMASLDSLRTYVKTQMDAVTSYNTKLDRTAVVMLSPSTAFVQATYSATNSLKDGRTLQWKSNAHLTMLAELRGGTWKIVALHGSAAGGVAVPK